MKLFPGTLIAKRMVDEEMDGESLLLLTRSDLVTHLGLKLGPAVKLYSAIEEWRTWPQSGREMA